MENPNAVGQAKNSEILTQAEKGQILERALSISSVDKYKITDPEEEGWLSEMYKKFQGMDLIAKYKGECSVSNRVKTFPVGKVSLLLDEVEKIVFVALHKGDRGLAEKAVRDSFYILNGAQKIDDCGRPSGGCICDECVGLSRMASALGLDGLASEIRHGTVCPEFNPYETVTLENFFRHDKEKFESADEYSKWLDDQLKWYIKLNRSKDDLHELYKEEKTQSQVEGAQSPELKRYADLVEEYNGAYGRSSRPYYFDQSSDTVNAFPGKKLSIPEGGLEDGLALKYLEDADNDFFNLDLRIYTDLPIGKKGEYSNNVADGKDFLKLPSDIDPKALKKTVNDKLAELIEGAKSGERYECHQVEKFHGMAKEAALISSVLTRLGDAEGAEKALALAKEACRKINDYSSQSGLKYLAIALAEIAKGSDPSEALDVAEGCYMHYIGGLDTYSGIGPTVRMHGLQNVAKVRVLAGLDPLPTLSKLGTIEDKISEATQISVEAFEIWAKIRSMIKELLEKK